MKSATQFSLAQEQSNGAITAPDKEMCNPAPESQNTVMLPTSGIPLHVIDVVHIERSTAMRRQSQASRTSSRRAAKTRLGILFGITLLLAVPSLAFLPAWHAWITETELNSPLACRTINGGDLCFTADAIQQIVNSNTKVDVYEVSQHAAHFDSESFAAASARLLTLKESVIANITAASPNGSAARMSLGQALHTLQDFYAHSNWVDRFSGINPQLGRLSFGPGDPGPPQVADLVSPTCPGNPDVLGGTGLTSVTTGYFESTNFCFAGPPEFEKCRHGGFPAFGCPNGISKDDDGRPNFAIAQSAAQDATLDFLGQILDYDGRPLPSGNSYPAVSNNAKAVKALMGLKFSTLGFAIDDTGSMGDIIDQVKTQVIGIVNGVIGTDDEPDQYVLEPINDPTVGPVVATNNASTFISAVNGLVASGGGDCPELAMSGLLQAINASDPGATFFSFTDASAKDDDLANAVHDAAEAKGITLNYALFGSCSPIDPAFLRLAAQTGGQVFVLARNEAGAITNLVSPAVGPASRNSYFRQ